MGVRGRRRLSSCGERGKNAEWHSADRRRPRSVAGDSAGADCGLDRGGKKCGPGLFGVEAGVSREVADWAGSGGRLSEGDAGVAAGALARARRTLHDGTDAREPTGGARGARRRGGGRCRPGAGGERGGNSGSARAESLLTKESTGGENNT